MKSRLAVLAVGTVLVLVACGRVPGSAGSSSPAPSAGGTVVITPLALPTGQVGLAYAQKAFVWSGGVPPYGYRISAGALPKGLVLLSDGSLTGTATESGAFQFTVEVTDTAGVIGNADNSLTLVPALTVSAGGVTVESGCDTVCGKYATVTGGQAPYTYALQSGTLPPGTALNGASLSGKFSSTGTYAFTVAVADAMGATATATATFTVVPHLYFYMPAADGSKVNYNAGTGHNFNCGQVADHPDCHNIMPFTGGVGSSYSASYTILNGTPTATLASNLVSVEATNDPSVSWAPHYVNVVVLYPPGLAGWNGVFLVTVTDQAICGPAAGTHCSAQAYINVGVRDPNLH